MAKRAADTTNAQLAKKRKPNTYNTTEGSLVHTLPIKELSQILASCSSSSHAKQLSLWASKHIDGASLKGQAQAQAFVKLLTETIAAVKHCLLATPAENPSQPKASRRKGPPKKILSSSRKRSNAAHHEQISDATPPQVTNEPPPQVDIAMLNGTQTLSQEQVNDAPQLQTNAVSQSQTTDGSQDQRCDALRKEMRNSARKAKMTRGTAAKKVLDEIFRKEKEDAARAEAIRVAEDAEAKQREEDYRRNEEQAKMEKERKAELDATTILIEFMKERLSRLHDVWTAMPTIRSLLLYEQDERSGQQTIENINPSDLASRVQKSRWNSAQAGQDDIPNMVRWSVAVYSMRVIEDEICRLLMKEKTTTPLRTRGQARSIMWSTLDYSSLEYRDADMIRSFNSWSNIVGRGLVALPRWTIFILGALSQKKLRRVLQTTPETIVTILTKSTQLERFHALAKQWDTIEDESGLLGKVWAQRLLTEHHTKSQGGPSGGSMTDLLLRQPIDPERPEAASQDDDDEAAGGRPVADDHDYEMDGTSTPTQRQNNEDNPLPDMDDHDYEMGGTSIPTRQQHNGDGSPPEHGYSASPGHPMSDSRSPPVAAKNKSDTFTEQTHEENQHLMEDDAMLQELVSREILRTDYERRDESRTSDIFLTSPPLISGGGETSDRRGWTSDDVMMVEGGQKSGPSGQPGTSKFSPSLPSQYIDYNEDYFEDLIGWPEESSTELWWQTSEGL